MAKIEEATEQGLEPLGGWAGFSALDAAENLLTRSVFSVGLGGILGGPQAAHP